MFYVSNLIDSCKCVLILNLMLIIFYTTGKDRIIFATKEDHESPSSAELIEEDPDDPYDEQGEEQ